VANRRDFFKSFAKPIQPANGESSPSLRPPYGVSESLFQKECPACEHKRCVASCEEEIIFLSDEGIPALTFKQNGCTFCDACAIACDVDVLSLEHRETAERLNAVFSISLEACVAHHGVICHSCKEPCLDDAILFNGLFNPVILEEKCTACGFCMARCPTQAITYRTYTLPEES